MRQQHTDLSYYLSVCRTLPVFPSHFWGHLDSSFCELQPFWHTGLDLGQKNYSILTPVIGTKKPQVLFPMSPEKQMWPFQDE